MIYLPANQKVAQEILSKEEKKISSIILFKLTVSVQRKIRTIYGSVYRVCSLVFANIHNRDRKLFAACSLQCTLVQITQETRLLRSKMGQGPYSVYTESARYKRGMESGGDE